MNAATLPRRDFLKTLGAGLAVLALAPRLAGQARGGGNAAPANLDAWLHVGADGRVTFFTGKTEIGQNIRTSLTQAVAEELPVPFDRIRMVMADTDLVPYDFGTVGSRTTPSMAPQLRRAAATAREALIDLASETWRVPRAEVTFSAGRLAHAASGRSADLGELAAGRRLVRTISADTPLKPASAWTIAGTSMPKIDGRAFVTGSHRFTIDHKVEGLHIGRILRPPAYGARLRDFDASRAAAMPGVTVFREGNVAGVVAPDAPAAARALAALQAQWELPSQASETRLFPTLKGGPLAEPEQAILPDGLRLRQTYTAAYIAHVPLEPRAAVAVWTDDRMTVWTGTQRPFGVRTEVARALRVDEERVRIVVPDTGSAYGGKHTGEAAVEAALLARAAGRPVRVAWTREEEFTWAYFRPAGVMEIASRTRPDGTLEGWSHDNYNSGAAGLAMIYGLPGARTQFHRADSPLRHGSYRTLAATANHFARETHLDEIAHALGQDPLAFRRHNLRDARLRDVLDAAAERFGWSHPSPGDGRGFGLALGAEKGSVVATCAEVHVDRASGSVRVVRVVQAFECGAVINPEHLKGQNEGCIIQGLGGALFERIHFADGRIANPRLSSYRVPRFSDLPTIEVILLDRKDQPSVGGSETPIVTIAPAVGNAIFAATGIRLRNLPMIPDGLRG
jgi:isoquinoline 1-oxidoreductase